MDNNRRPRIFVYIHYLEIGGAERALIGLLDAFDPRKVEVDLFVNQHTGELLKLVPDHVRLLPQLPEYSAIERPVKEIAMEGHISVALRRMWAKYLHRRHVKALAEPPQADESIFHYVFGSVEPALRDLGYLGEYDLALSFLAPHHIVLSKVRARKKICWIHTDYSRVHIDAAAELPVWSGYDGIVAISPDAARTFGEVFPQLRKKLTVVENILSASFVRRQAAMERVDAEMPRREGMVNILSVGRFSVAKRFEAVPQMCRILLDKGLRFRWYIVGYGPDEEIRRNIARYDVGGTLVILGKKQNPYPYIQACDIYAQPSIFEGKSVTVREAQILGKPPVITAYPTAASQVADGVDGKIVPLDIEGCAAGIYDFAGDADLRRTIAENLRHRDFGNMDEVGKIYDMIP